MVEDAYGETVEAWHPPFNGPLFQVRATDDTFTSSGQNSVLLSATYGGVQGIVVTYRNACQRYAALDSCDRMDTCKFYHAALGSIMGNLATRSPALLGSINPLFTAHQRLTRPTNLISWPADMAFKINIMKKEIMDAVSQQAEEANQRVQDSAREQQFMNDLVKSSIVAVPTKRLRAPPAAPKPLELGSSVVKPLELGFKETPEPSAPPAKKMKIEPSAPSSVADLAVVPQPVTEATTTVMLMAELTAMRAELDALRAQAAAATTTAALAPATSVVPDPSASVDVAPMPALQSLRLEPATIVADPPADIEPADSAAAPAIDAGTDCEIVVMASDDPASGTSSPYTPAPGNPVLSPGTPVTLPNSPVFSDGEGNVAI